MMNHFFTKTIDQEDNGIENKSYEYFGFGRIITEDAWLNTKDNPISFRVRTSKQLDGFDGCISFNHLEDAMNWCRDNADHSDKTVRLPRFADSEKTEEGYWVARPDRRNDLSKSMSDRYFGLPLVGVDGYICPVVHEVFWELKGDKIVGWDEKLEDILSKCVEICKQRRDQGIDGYGYDDEDLEFDITDTPWEFEIVG